VSGRSILPELVSRKTDRRPLRIWVIPSSSGEEPYSIALYLLEYWAGIEEWDVEIISSDIDTRILADARPACSRNARCSTCPKPCCASISPAAPRAISCDDSLRDAVEFTRVNLSERADTRPYRNFDVIFCRNLLIYFDDLSRKTAAETFYDALKPGGHICLGHSESMSRISSLYKVRKFPDAIVYQNPWRADETHPDRR
jgi:chemotaxis protein methyltransferase CheR